MNALKIVKNPPFWLLVIATSLIAINLTLTFKTNQLNLLGISFVFWAAVFFLVWEKRHKLNLESDIFSSLLGLALIIFVLFKSAFPINLGGVINLLPWISAFAVALLASGFKGLKQYWGELLVLFCFFPSKVLTPLLINISALTAKFAALILWSTGFKVIYSGINIILPTGGVKVNFSCSGIEQIFDLLGLAILFILIFSVNWKQKIYVPAVAAALGFVVNGVRVAIMTVLAAKGDRPAFTYWHTGDGSLIFSLIGGIIFGCFCWILLTKNETKSQDYQGY